MAETYNHMHSAADAKVKGWQISSNSNQFQLVLKRRNLSLLGQNNGLSLNVVIISKTKRFKGVKAPWTHHCSRVTGTMQHDAMQFGQWQPEIQGQSHGAVTFRYHEIKAT
jgi:hypothetical protein